MKEQEIRLHIPENEGRKNNNVLETPLFNTLRNSVKRWDFFAENENDEFRITRENLETQGIFKTWAPHILPKLDSELNTDPVEWSRVMAEKPLQFFENLEHWRGFSEVWDRRLQQIFAAKEIPNDQIEAAAELFLRLELAFSFSAPFYNIEALVADSRMHRSDNPITFEVTTEGGSLDVVAMLLPSALKDILIADTLSWNNISWEKLENQVNTLRTNLLTNTDTLESKQFLLLMNIAKLANVETVTVLFAANALQFIPTNVGGKKDDIDQQIALEKLLNLISNHNDEGVTTNIIAKDVNALIRFLNWLPAIKAEENFQGSFWNYDAVCATSTRLLNSIKKFPEIFRNQEFALIFQNTLAPQLDSLDATSAKGRFLMQLLTENVFSSQLVRTIEHRKPFFLREMNTALQKIKEEEIIVPILDKFPSSFVGGKTKGLREASELFTSNHVLDGFVLTSEAINDWFNANIQMTHLIELLHRASDINSKIVFGKQIATEIFLSKLPRTIIQTVQSIFPSNQHIVLRSSSFDEDNDCIGTAPGIYESVVDIDTNDDINIEFGIKTVVASFFSEKAISFRELKGLSHTPRMAILIQKFIDSPGGTLFIQDGIIRMNIAPRACEVTPDNTTLENLTVLSSELIENNIQSSLLNQKQIAQLGELARIAQLTFGSSDLEFVVDDENNQIKLLQLRPLNGKTTVSHKEHVQPTQSIVLMNTLSLPEIVDNASLELIIGGDIDLEKFQGTLLRWLISNKDKIQEISLKKRIPATCHFANIIGGLGIKLNIPDTI